MPPGKFFRHACGGLILILWLLLLHAGIIREGRKSGPAGAVWQIEELVELID